MQGKGLLGDALVYTSLAYAYLNDGNPTAASEMFDDMFKKRLMITAKIYNWLSVSYADKNGILDLFLDHATQKGLIAKNVFKLMQHSNC